MFLCKSMTFVFEDKDFKKCQPYLESRLSMERDESLLASLYTLKGSGQYRKAMGLFQLC